MHCCLHFTSQGGVMFCHTVSIQLAGEMVCHAVSIYPAGEMLVTCTIILILKEIIVSVHDLCDWGSC